MVHKAAQTKSILIKEDQMNKQEFIKKLIEIQNELVVQKTINNDFGGFKYRNAEQITAKIKPICKKHGILIYTISESKQIGDRYYQVVTAIATDGENELRVSAEAREADHKTKQDDAQLTGGAISYAKKYALGQLLNIDDSSSDPDASKPEPITEESLEILSQLISESIELGYRPKIADEDITKWTEEKASDIIGRLTVKVEKMKAGR